MPTTSCIIPFYNESPRLYGVLDQMVRVAGLLEIICVDDGSDCDISDEIRERYPSVTVLRLPKNCGKTGAVRAGLKQAAGDLILLMDADLRHLDYREVEAANLSMQKHPDIDMLILRQVKEPRLIRALRGDVLVTGERIMKKSDLTAILQGGAERWELESVINQYMYERKKTVFWVPFSARNTYKPWKWGIKSSIKNDPKTQWDILFGAGFGNILRHYFFFAKDELDSGDGR